MININRLIRHGLRDTIDILAAIKDAALLMAGVSVGAHLTTQDGAWFEYYSQHGYSVVLFCFILCILTGWLVENLDRRYPEREELPNG
jgi:hypothetical protein